MTKELHHHRAPYGVISTTSDTSMARNLDASPNWERIIPVPSALVTDGLIADMTASIDRAERVGKHREADRERALRDALIAGRPKPEPLAEPTDLAARVIDRQGYEWAKQTNGRLWVCLTDSGAERLDWARLALTYGPLRLAGATS